MMKFDIRNQVKSGFSSSLMWKKSNMQQVYGYIRVSTRDQNEERQVIAMREFGAPEENMVIDKQSGKNFARPGYRRLVKN